MKRLVGIVLVVWLVGCSRPGAFYARLVATQGHCADQSSFQIGSGVYDITGPAAQVGMAGYGMVNQKTAGIHTRLRSRAFVIVSPCNGHRVAFVSADLQGIPRSIKQGVVERLHQRFSDQRYGEDNVLLSAIHTHSGPGGYAYNALLNLTVLGFNRQNYDAIVDGVVASIVRADSGLRPGVILINSGNLFGASINRSPIAYRENQGAGADAPTNKLMTVLKFKADRDSLVGMISWFAVHATSMSNANHLISADNKGYASYLFERQGGTRYDAETTFVAAFAQSEEGDASPNICNPDIPGATDSVHRDSTDVRVGDCQGGGVGGGGDDFARTGRSGTRQFQWAMALYDSARERLKGGVDYRHTFVRMDDLVLPDTVSGDTVHHRITCRGAVGLGFTAGSPDGRGPLKLHEGVTCIQAAAAGWPVTCLGRDPWDCQGVKPRLVITGAPVLGATLTPNILSLQIVTIGDLALVAVPFELTTTAGERVRSHVLRILQPRISRVIIAGLANDYAGYLATPEEYNRQFYEGAFTLFGRWTLDVLIHETRRLALALKNDAPVDPGIPPPDLSRSRINLEPGVLMDATPPGIRFGDVETDASPVYRSGDTVRVTFWGAHPNNDLHIQRSFLKVQRKESSSVSGDSCSQNKDGSWRTVANDWDWSTRFEWRRSRCVTLFACSLVTVEWSSDGVPEGTYRICHFGVWKSINGDTTTYVGTSREFRVVKNTVREMAGSTLHSSAAAPDDRH